MILFFYNFALFSVLILGSPWWLFRLATTHRYREGLFQRLGFRRTGVQSDKPIIWIHAVSVGEVLAIGRLVQSLDESLPQFQIAISTTTRTGQHLARERFGKNRVFYCPLDLPWAVGRVLNELNPQLLILAETEFWPNLLATCKHRKVPVAVVNARISDRSWPRYQALRGLWRSFLSGLTLILAQTEIDAARLHAIGCTADRVHVGGNLKFDVRTVHESEAKKLLRESAVGKKIVVAGSTLEGEESALLSVWPALLTLFPNLLLILAPRHPERFGTVAKLLEESSLTWQLRSLWRLGLPHHKENLGTAQVVLLDSIGELASVYQLAQIAFIGGSLVPAGGHNPLEPAQFATPILMGPSYENFRGIVAPMIAANGIQIVDSTTNLNSAIVELLSDHAKAKAMGQQAHTVFENQAGATEKTVAAIRELINSNVSGTGGSR
jgi:3-deoxy-D-manno-octulosonic-acid transferase